MFNGQIDTNTVTIYTLLECNYDLGLKDYTIFDESYRPILNKAILDFYLFHEIGYVNQAVFRNRLNARMDLIMRNKYNALYIAKAKEFNPLYTLDVYDEYTHSVTNNVTGETNITTNASNNTTDTNNINVNTDVNSESSNDTLALSSRYPSEDMANDDLTSNVYLTGGQKNTSKSGSNDNTEETTTANGTSNTTIAGTDKRTNTGNNTTTESYSKHSYGSASDLSFAHAMTQFKDYCDKFDLDLQVINELKDLFYNLY